VSASSGPQHNGARGEFTRAVHLPLPPAVNQRSMGLPVWRTAAFAFADAQEYVDVLGGQRDGYSYSRLANPTADAFAAAVAALEGVGLDGEVRGEAFGSGMAAITAILMGFTAAGAHVVAPREMYGGTYAVLADVLSRFGVRTDHVDTTDPAAVSAAVRPETRLVWAETLANPTMTVADLPMLADIAHRAGALLAVDSTFATPAVCRPLEHGADLVVHSATKYIGGHSDVTGGVVVARPELAETVRHVREHTGGILAPDEAFLLRRGLETLPLRMGRQCAGALTLATALAAHPRVARVDYPGLPGHRDHELANRLFDAGPEGRRYGAVVTVTPYADSIGSEEGPAGTDRGAANGRDVGMALVDGLQLATVATSLGGTHTKVGPVAGTTHRQLDPDALTGAGIFPGAVRFSVGLEDPDDLVADAVAALDALG